MRHRKNKVTLDRPKAPRAALFRSLVLSLVEHGKITTTLAKARAIRPFTERLITHAKQDTVQNRRYLMQRLHNDAAVKKLVTTWGPKFTERHGGYTRLVKLPNRVGDGAARALIEFV